MRRAENKTHSGKWARKDEFVPTGQSPATRVFEVQWYDLCAGFLREQNDPAAGSIYGTARTIRGDDDIVTRCDDVGQMQHSGRAFARAGAADDREPKSVHQLSQPGAIAAGADSGRARPLRHKAMNGEGKQE